MCVYITVLVIHFNVTIKCTKIVISNVPISKEPCFYYAK